MLTKVITENDIKKIFSNKTNKQIYLKKLFETMGKTVKIEDTKERIDQQIIDTWEYDTSKNIIRDMFVNHPKYIRQKGLEKEIDAAISDWRRLDLGELKWPFSAQSFDGYVHKLNRDDSILEEEKDNILTKEIVKFRRIKNINALRNDYIESLIFENENVIPTLGNNEKVDFYIKGEPYDQKVAKSVGTKFKEKYGENYRRIAMEHPELVAKSLYENQDKQRFGYESRLLIVYLDSDVSSQRIKEQLELVDFTSPYKFMFEYKHSKGIVSKYKTSCFVVLLYNKRKEK